MLGVRYWVGLNWMANGKVTKAGHQQVSFGSIIQGLSDKMTKKEPVPAQDDARARSKLRTGVAAHKPGVRNINISIRAACTNFLLNG